MLLTFSDKDDICEKSGEELLASLKEANNDGDSDNSFNCTFVNGSNNAIFVNCPTYKHFDSAYVMITKDTEIVFADGSKATIDDIEGELIVTTDGSIRKLPATGNSSENCYKMGWAITFVLCKGISSFA